MQHELTKAEKRLARELIDKGLQQEYQNAIKDLDKVISKWKHEKLDNRSAYSELYGTLREHNKHIAGRYDAISGSRYLMTVGLLLADGLITQEDIEGFRDDSREYLNRIISLKERHEKEAQE